MKEFFKWFLDTQLIKEKAPVWREFFMNAIALFLILTFVYITITGQKTTNEFNILLSMVLGFYFNHKHQTKDSKDE